MDKGLGEAETVILLVVIDCAGFCESVTVTL